MRNGLHSVPQVLWAGQLKKQGVENRTGTGTGTGMGMGIIVPYNALCLHLAVGMYLSHAEPASYY